MKGPVSPDDQLSSFAGAWALRGNGGFPKVCDRSTIAPSGWTYEDTFVLYDRETGSLWYPVRGGLRAIQGEHFGKTLPELSSEDTSWSRWLAENPGSRILE